MPFVSQTHLELCFAFIYGHNIFGDVLHDWLQVSLVISGVVLLCWRLEQTVWLQQQRDKLETLNQPFVFQTHPRQPIEQQLRETQGGSSDLRGPVVHHVVVEEGQLHQILGQCVSLYIRLRQTSSTHRMFYKVLPVVILEQHLSNTPVSLSTAGRLGKT